MTFPVKSVAEHEDEFVVNKPDQVIPIKSLPMAGFFSELVKAPKSQFAFPFNLHETLFPEID